MWPCGPPRGWPAPPCGSPATPRPCRPRPPAPPAWPPSSSLWSCAEAAPAGCGPGCTRAWPPP
ncbi:hypothetical protein EEZ25_34250 [Micromonospora aurantiaca]|nr:hypothetical protein EEZ25_34250 [Micromonospora aurantiaca]